MFTKLNNRIANWIMSICSTHTITITPDPLCSTLDIKDIVYDALNIYHYNKPVHVDIIIKRNSNTHVLPRINIGTFPDGSVVRIVLK